MATTRIEVRSDGSIKVEGDFELVDQNGKAFGLNGRTKIALCRCGHSANKPFCDGSHKAVGLRPMTFTAEKSGEAWLCGCKASANKPFCDGSHNKIK